jgi:hypothetical protein
MLQLHKRRPAGQGGTARQVHVASSRRSAGSSSSPVGLEAVQEALRCTLPVLATALCCRRSLLQACVQSDVRVSIEAQPIQHIAHSSGSSSKAPKQQRRRSTL